MLGIKILFKTLFHLPFCSISKVSVQKKVLYRVPAFSAVLFAGNTARMRSSFLHVSFFLQSYTILSLAIFLLHDESTLGSRRLPFYTKVDYKFSFLK